MLARPDPAQELHGIDCPYVNGQPNCNCALMCNQRNRFLKRHPDTPDLAVAASTDVQFSFQLALLMREYCNDFPEDGTIELHSTQIFNYHGSNLRFAIGGRVVTP